MHTSGIVIFSLVAVIWVFQAFRAIQGTKKLPWVKDFEPARNEECPGISLIFAARDEEEKLPAALATLDQASYSLDTSDSATET